MLRSLNLVAFNQYLDEFNQQAIEQTWSYSDLLSKLCEVELASLYFDRLFKRATSHKKDFEKIYCFNSVVQLEFIVGALNKRELKKINKIISELNIFLSSSSLDNIEF
jgi:hypothetical protein